MTPINDIFEAACKVTGLTAREMRCTRRFRVFVRARLFAARKMRAEGYSYPAIAKALGGFNHTTIMYHLRKRKRWEMT